MSRIACSIPRRVLSPEGREKETRDVHFRFSREEQELSFDRTQLTWSSELSMSVHVFQDLPTLSVRAWRRLIFDERNEFFITTMTIDTPTILLRISTTHSFHDHLRYIRKTHEYQYEEKETSATNRRNRLSFFWSFTHHYSLDFSLQSTIELHGIHRCTDIYNES